MSWAGVHVTLHVKVAGTWRQVIDAPYDKVAGTWRTVSQGYIKVAGTWRQFYQRDISGPAAPTAAQARWNSGPCLVTWTNPSDSDFAGVRVYRTRGSTNDGLIATITSGTFGPGAAASLSDSDIRENFLAYTYRIEPYDTIGNVGPSVSVTSMAYTGYPRGRYPNPFVVDPYSSGTWRNGAWRNDVGNRPYQGYTPNGMNVGAYFYAGLHGLTGATISNMTLDLYRYPAGGQGGGIFPSLWVTQSHYVNDGTDPSTSVAFNALAAPMARNGSAPQYQVVPLPGTWYDALCNWNVLPAYYGIALFDLDTLIQPWGASANYGYFFGAGEQPGTVVPGRLTITHTG